jgi:hypothetical protein
MAVGVSNYKLGGGVNMKKRNKLFAVVLVLALSLSLTIPAFAATSGDITVTCDGVTFTGFNDGDNVQLEVRLHETSDWQSPRLQDDYITLPTGPFDVFVPWDDPDGVIDGQLYRTAIRVNGVTIALDEGYHDCPPEEGAYCSPGYFKRHLDAWAPTGYSPDNDFDATFGVDFFDPDITLLDAVNAKGGGFDALARVGTASLLSAAHPGVNYPLTETEVIAAVQAGDKATLDQYIDFDCPID